MRASSSRGRAARSRRVSRRFRTRGPRKRVREQRLSSHRRCATRFSASLPSFRQSRSSAPIRRTSSASSGPSALRNSSPLGRANGRRAATSTRRSDIRATRTRGGARRSGSRTRCVKPWASGLISPPDERRCPRSAPIRPAPRRGAEELPRRLRARAERGAEDRGVRARRADGRRRGRRLGQDAHARLSRLASHRRRCRPGVPASPHVHESCRPRDEAPRRGAHRRRPEPRDGRDVPFGRRAPPAPARGAARLSPELRHPRLGGREGPPRVRDVRPRSSRHRAALPEGRPPPGDRVALREHRAAARRRDHGRASALPSPARRDPRGRPSLSRAKGFSERHGLSLIHISEPTRLGMISYAVFCLKKKKKKKKIKKKKEYKKKKQKKTKKKKKT